MRLTDAAAAPKSLHESSARNRPAQARSDRTRDKPRAEAPKPSGAMADAFARLKR
jgi:hypothetical protein